jgi:hypothetical protein
MKNPMDTSRLNKLPPKNTLRYKKLLQSGSLGTLVAGKAVKILDAENLEEGNFVRCEVVWKAQWGYLSKLMAVDVPEIALHRIMSGEKEFHTPTRAIVDDGSSVGNAETIFIRWYDKNTHEIIALWQHSWLLRFKIPIAFSSYDNVDSYKWSNLHLKTNPTEPEWVHTPIKVDKSSLAYRTLFRDTPPPLPPLPEEKSGRFFSLFRRKKAS